MKTISIAGSSVTGMKSQAYSGKARTQTPTVKLNGVTLISGTDYTLSYKNNMNAGTATLTIKGTGNYSGSIVINFTIAKAVQTLTLKAGASAIAVGKTTTVSVGGAKGTKTFKSSNTSVASVTSSGKVTAKKVGTVRITLTSAATSNYKAASKYVTIKVLPAATKKITAANLVTGIRITWQKVPGANGYILYRSGTRIAAINSGSTVSYTDKKANTNGTKYTYKLVAKASTGTSTLSRSLSVFRVSRPAVKTLVNNSAKSMTVKWGKNAKATGYQIQYSRSKTFASGNKTITISKAATVSKVIGKLTKGSIYYVRIRSYRTSGSITSRSAWSPARSVKINK